MAQLTKSNAREVANLRTHLRYGNGGAYARGMSGLHRAANARQQEAIEAVIREDDCAPFFKWSNGALIALPGLGMAENAA